MSYIIVYNTILSPATYMSRGKLSWPPIWKQKLVSFVFEHEPFTSFNDAIYILKIVKVIGVFTYLGIYGSKIRGLCSSLLFVGVFIRFVLILQKP